MVTAIVSSDGTRSEYLVLFKAPSYSVAEILEQAPYSSFDLSKFLFALPHRSSLLG